MFCMLKEKICPDYVSKHNWNCEKQIIPKMISNEEICKTKSEGCQSKCEGRRWHYLAVKKLSPLLRGITLNIMGILIVWIVFILLG